MEHRKPRPPSVAVIIPAYNAAATLGEALQAVLDQEYKGIEEIIVVDDGSTDATRQVAASFPSVRCLRQDHNGPAAARNAGAAQAASDLLFFTDADCIPERRCVARLAARFGDPSVAAVAGSYETAAGDRMLGRWIGEEILFRHRRRLGKPIAVFGGYNVAVRRSTFEELGGFDVKFLDASGEDNDLSYRLRKSGRRICFERAAVVRHLHPHAFAPYMREQFRHGFWRARLYKKHPDMLAGDGYTFWKDIVEWPLAVLASGLAPLCLLAALVPLGIQAAALGALGIVTAALAALELSYAARVVRTAPEILLFGLTMAVRSLFRGYGFLAGCVLCRRDRVACAGALAACGAGARRDTAG